MPALSGSGESGALFGTAIGKGQVMSITASEARKVLFPLIKKVNDNHEAIEIVSKRGNAVLVSAEDYAALRALRRTLAACSRRTRMPWPTSTCPSGI